MHGRGVIIAKRPGRGRSWWSRVLPRTLGVALTALLVLPAAAGMPPAEAKKKSRTITATFSSAEMIVIDDQDADNPGPADRYPATITVPGSKKLKKAKITDVNLTLHGLSHGEPDDIDVMLAFGNRRAIVLSDIGGSDNTNNTSIALDDESLQALPVNSAVISGVYRPQNVDAADIFAAPAPLPNGSVALSTFDGLNPTGEWRLFIMDDTLGGIGWLDGGWELEITVKVKKKGKK